MKSSKSDTETDSFQKFYITEFIWEFGVFIAVCYIF